MNSEDMFAVRQKEIARRVKKAALNMSTFSWSTLYQEGKTLNFKVELQIWQDDDLDYYHHLEYLKKLVEEHIEINNTTYKTIADELFILLAADFCNREITISISSAEWRVGNTGIKITYHI